MTRTSRSGRSVLDYDPDDPRPARIQTRQSLKDAQGIEAGPDSACRQCTAASSCGSDCLCPNARLASMDEISTLLATACIEVIGCPIGFQALNTPAKYKPDLRPERDSNARPTA
jgi:hypothetical protein